MKKSLIALALLATLAGCSKVPAGNVGVKFNLYGGDKGVQMSELPPGRYWIGVNEELYLFPTFTQNYTWTADGKDESLSFQTIEGLNVKADVGITYYVDPGKVSAVFQKYRKGIDEITNTFLRNMVRDALVTQGSKVGIESVYGAGKSDLMDKVLADVQRQTKDIGIIVEKLYWVGNLGLPPTVVDSINAKIQATQMSQQRNNEIAQTEAEAQKRRAEAQGEADAQLTLAKAEADAIRIKGEALRMNPSVIQLNAVERWDGKLPVYTGENVPLISLK